MSKASKWNGVRKVPKTDFHALLCGTSKPILEQWKNGEADSPNLPWSLKTNQQRNFSDSDLEYLAKIKALTEMSDHIYSGNLKLKYRLNAVAKEIKHLKRVKRVLCRRLFEHNSKELVGTYLEIPDSDTSTVVMDQIIGDVVNTATQANRIAPTLVVKKKRKDPKMSQNAKLPPVTAASKEDEIHQHIISVIDNVANTNYKTSNGPTPSKKPRKQNLSALMSPSKEAATYPNGNSSFVPRESQVKVLKLGSSPTPVSSSTFTSPINLPIYVKRELIYPPERREQKTVLPIPNSTTITSVMYSVPSTLANSNMNVPKQGDSSISNGQSETNPKNHHSSSPVTSKSTSLDTTPENMPSDSTLMSKTYYSDHSSVYTTSALTREIKSLSQSRINSNSNQLVVPQQTDELRTQICAGTVPNPPDLF